MSQKKVKNCLLYIGQNGKLSKDIVIILRGGTKSGWIISLAYEYQSKQFRLRDYLKMLKKVVTEPNKERNLSKTIRGVQRTVVHLNTDEGNTEIFEIPRNIATKADTPYSYIQAMSALSKN